MMNAMNAHERGRPAAAGAGCCGWQFARWRPADGDLDIAPGQPHVLPGTAAELQVQRIRGARCIRRHRAAVLATVAAQRLSKERQLVATPPGGDRQQRRDDRGGRPRRGGGADADASDRWRHRRTFAEQPDGPLRARTNRDGGYGRGPLGQPAVPADAPEVGLTVGNARVRGWRAHFQTLTLSSPRRQVQRTRHGRHGHSVTRKTMVVAQQLAPRGVASVASLRGLTRSRRRSILCLRGQSG